MSFEKYYNENRQVGVLVSGGYGAGWYSWNREYEGLLYDKEIVEAVLADDYDLVIKIAQEKYPDAYLGGAEDLYVEFMEKGTPFRIDEYDGNESVEYGDRVSWNYA